MNEDRYINLLKTVLTGNTGRDEFKPYYSASPRLKARMLMGLNSAMKKFNLAVCRINKYDPEKRRQGTDWPAYAETMIGQLRLDNIQFCVENIIKDNVPGDLIETGVWRGGATIFMAGLLQAYGDKERNVWVADSFAGLPKPSDKFEADKGDKHYTYAPDLAVSMEQVKKNFEKYGLLSDNVKFLKGWFSQTLPTAPIEKLSLARLDGDMYESTMDGLDNLYPKLSIGGYIIIDDYGAIPACKKAVDYYRELHSIVEPIEVIDWTGVFWRKQK